MAEEATLTIMYHRDMEPVMPVLVGALIGALATGFVKQREWLRERRHEEYAGLLVAFRNAIAESSKAAQGASIVSASENPDHLNALAGLVRSAWDAGDEFLAAYARVSLVASRRALLRAEELRDFVLWLRKFKPLSDEEDAELIDLDAFPRINQKGGRIATSFADSASYDILRLRFRVGRRRVGITWSKFPRAVSVLRLPTSMRAKLNKVRSST